MPSDISGRVLDNNRRPVAKAKISLKGKVVAESDDAGFFSVALAKAESRVALTFAAEGYVSNTKVYDAKAKAGIVIVVVWPIAYRVKFDPSRDFDVELGSSRIQISANALAGPSEEKLAGPVALRFTLFDITSPLQRVAASGDFSGQMLDRSIQRLNSFGIFDFAVHDLKGGVLSVRRGAKIDLAIPIPRKLADKAPKQVGYFDFNASAGRWIQVGTFELAPRRLTYNGSITRFAGPDGDTSHNLDIPQDITCVTVQIVNPYDTTGMPGLPGAWVLAQGAQYFATGTTNAQGFVCLLVERGANFTVTAQGSFGSSNYATPHPVVFTAPNFSSGASDCGDPVKCPLLGTVPIDFIVGTGHHFLFA